MSYTKQDVKFHSDGFRPSRPAINIKAHHTPMPSEIAKRFGCSEPIAERAAEFAFNSACHSFFEGAEDYAREIFSGYSIEVYQEGRSGGWLVIHGLPDFESWDAVLLGKWHKLEKYCHDNIAYQTSLEAFAESIEANRWNEEGAEEYNFMDRGNESVCIVDVKREAEAAIPEPLRDVVRIEIGKKRS